MCWTDAPRIGGRAAAALALLALAACSDTPAGHGGPGDVSFGLSVADNLRMMTGEGLTEAQRTRLQAEFRRAAPDRAEFAFDSARIDAEARAALERQAAWLRLNPMALMRLEGHADLVGGEPYNARLGLRRAEAAATALAGLGVHPSRLAVIESLGETRPLVPVERPERRNRRVEISLEGWGEPASGRGFDGKRALLAYLRYVADEAEAVEADTVGGDS